MEFVLRHSCRRTSASRYLWCATCCSVCDHCAASERRRQARFPRSLAGPYACSTVHGRIACGLRRRWTTSSSTTARRGGLRRVAHSSRYHSCLHVLRMRMRRLSLLEANRLQRATKTHANARHEGNGGIRRVASRRGAALFRRPLAIPPSMSSGAGTLNCSFVLCVALQYMNISFSNIKNGRFNSCAMFSINFIFEAVHCRGSVTLTLGTVSISRRNSRYRLVSIKIA